VSTNLIAVDIEVPSDEASEIVKAMAKQVVAYCLRNMERLQDISPSAAMAMSEVQNDAGDIKGASYPDVIAHLVGHDVMNPDEVQDTESAPDEDYVIGGTGVVKALTACLKNRTTGDDDESDELVREVQNGEAATDAELQSGGKAKDMSKHLLAGARKIRRRLQPALDRAKATPSNENDLRKLVFLDETLQGIIKRFEDEYPDTRENYINVSNDVQARNRKTSDTLSSSPPATEEYPPAVSDEEEAEIHPSRPLSRSNSMLSKTQAEEEGRVMRAGHRFRSDYLTEQRFDMLLIDDIGGDPKHLRLLDDLAEELGGDFLALVRTKGTVRAFKEDKEVLFRQMRENDPEHWERFMEAQQKARANISMPQAGDAANESAIED
jgi:hypothetical protein